MQLGESGLLYVCSRGLEALRALFLVIAVSGLTVGTWSAGHEDHGPAEGWSHNALPAVAHGHAVPVDGDAGGDVSQIACSLFVCATGASALASADVATPVRYRSDGFAFFSAIVPLEGLSPEHDPPVPRERFPTVS